MSEPACDRMNISSATSFLECVTVCLALRSRLGLIFFYGRILSSSSFLVYLRVILCLYYVCFIFLSCLFRYYFIYSFVAYAVAKCVPGLRVSMIVLQTTTITGPSRHLRLGGGGGDGDGAGGCGSVLSLVAADGGSGAPLVPPREPAGRGLCRCWTLLLAAPVAAGAGRLRRWLAGQRSPGAACSGRRVAGPPTRRRGSPDRRVLVAQVTWCPPRGPVSGVSSWSGQSRAILSTLAKPPHALYHETA